MTSPITHWVESGRQGRTRLEPDQGCARMVTKPGPRGVGGGERNDVEDPLDLSGEVLLLCHSQRRCQPLGHEVSVFEGQGGVRFGDES